ncbi:S-adenosyl-L-methionine-dependent methyltransferase [Dichomitus squalens LYAD-421 SS1]|uniref:phosphoethanolamine N-methyltransferase n=1 Tax=Dichomitus squalens (strain LYAD-421) TaxID=732165 RepID=R7SRA7_DICSQ|nr:S-adenosyl-L-methionine-dependent methyltransferase [Dichomitus squalens LYAD-421 SS1]EJF58684.1 S-adenosyl-L-methionine-dependent methyltransferase [Dichomitus squalens LYAD-421 SS1]
MATEAPPDLASTLSPEELKAIIARGYDTIAPQYLAWSGPRPTTTRAAYVAQLLDLLDPGASILELGCGAGVPTTQTIAAHPKKFHVTGVDISAAQVALAREHIGRGRVAFEHADMAKLHYEEGSFEAVLAFYSIFHLPREEQPAMIGKVVKWLKPGGYLLLNMNTKDEVVHREDWMGAPMFSFGIGVEGNRRAFEEYGKGLKILVDEVAVEKVGRFEETFHWFFAQKE